MQNRVEVENRAKTLPVEARFEREGLKTEPSSRCALLVFKRGEGGMRRNRRTTARLVSHAHTSPRNRFTAVLEENKGTALGIGITSSFLSPASRPDGKPPHPFTKGSEVPPDLTAVRFLAPLISSSTMPPSGRVMVLVFLPFRKLLFTGNRDRLKTSDSGNAVNQMQRAEVYSKGTSKGRGFAVSLDAWEKRKEKKKKLAEVPCNWSRGSMRFFSGGMYLSTTVSSPRYCMVASMLPSACERKQNVCHVCASRDDCS